MNPSSTILMSEETKKRITTISGYLNKLREHLNVDTPSDILKDVYSDTEDDELTEEQIIERKRRQKACSLLMYKFRTNSLPPIEEFDPKDLL